MKKAKIEERVWNNTTQGRFARMGRKEKFVKSVKSVVDVLTQAGLVIIPEDLVLTLQQHGLLTKREVGRLLSITAPKVTKIKVTKDTIKAAAIIEKELRKGPPKKKKKRVAGKVTQVQQGKKVTVAAIVVPEEKKAKRAPSKKNRKTPVLNGQPAVLN